jgi:hypothetical protein
MRSYFVALVAAVTCTFPGGVIACSCVAFADVEQFQQAHAVFVAKVVSTQRVDTSEGVERRAQVAPTHRLKGDPWSIPYVTTTTSGCGLPLTVGSTYLIFADSAGKTSMCSGSRWVDGELLTADEAISELQEELRRAEAARE